MTREGWYYLAVLAFIVGGAVLRSINLLVILSGMLIAPLIINWRLVMASLTGLAVRRKLPRQAIAGEPFTVEIGIENSRWWMSSWLVKAEDWIERQGEDEPSARSEHAAASREPQRPTWRRWLAQRLSRLVIWHESAHAEAIIAHVPARGSGIGTYRATLHRRGRYRFGPLRLSTRFPLGLVSAHITLPDYAELLVAPRLGRLLPPWNELLAAELVGDQQRHPQRGLTEGDYYGLRPWQSGDSMRWIHWRTTARLGRPIVRQYERRKSRDVAFVVDPWLPARPSERELGLVELVFSLAATAVADLTRRGQSRLTCAIAGSTSESLTGPAAGLFCDELFERLAKWPAGGDDSLADAIQQAIDAAPSGSRLLVISSRAADAPSLTAALAELPLDPADFAWIDVGSPQLETLFVLE